MNRADRADELHNRKFNCCQSVACVFADAVGVDEVTLYKVCEGFGGGMGTEMGVCGALCGAAVISGLVNSDGNTECAGQTKAKSTGDAGIIQKRFEEEIGALICHDIKTGNNGEPYTSCANCIRTAVRLAEEVLGL